MSLQLLCLLGAVAWTLLLAFALVTWRGLAALRGERRLDEFPAGVPHGSDAYWRLNRAHLNCLENLPLLASVVLAGEHLGVTMNTLAAAWLAARVGQSATHLASGAPAAVFVRASFFVMQLGCLAAMVVTLVRTG